MYGSVQAASASWFLNTRFLNTPKAVMASSSSSSFTTTTNAQQEQQPQLYNHHSSTMSTPLMNAAGGELHIPPHLPAALPAQQQQQHSEHSALLNTAAAAARSVHKRQHLKRSGGGQGSGTHTPLLIKHDGTEHSTQRSDSFLIRAFSSMEEGSLRGSILTLVSSALGTGILALAYVMSQAGFFAGALSLFACAALAVYSIYILVACGNRTGIKNFSALTTHVFGRRQGQILELVIVVYGFGVLVSYLKILGSSVHEVMLTVPGLGERSLMDNKDFMLGSITLILVFPLSLLRNLTSLRYATMFSVASMLYVTAAVVVRSVQHGSFHHIEIFKFGWQTFPAFTISLFAYTCQINVFSVYSELHNPLVRRMRKITRRSVILEVALYITMAVAGYTLFHDQAADNILLNFDTHDVLFIIARLCVSIALIVALPLNLNPARKNLEQIFFADKPFSLVRHLIETFVFLALALALAIVVPKVSDVFGLLGATCCVYFCYALPTLLYLNVFGDELSATVRYSCYGVMTFVVVMGALSVGVTVRGFFH